MNKLIKRSILTLSVIILTLNIVNAETYQQQADSLTLGSIIKQVISNYPTVKIAEEAIVNAESRISMARTGFNPEADVTASVSTLGPVTKLTLPQFGTFQLYPGNNYAAALNIRQTLWDFGRTHQAVALENEGKALSEQTLEQVKEKLALYTVSNFYTILYLQAAIKIKDQQLATLNEHLQYIEKVAATGSATEYQVLSTKVRISAVESQKVDLAAALKTQQAVLSSLLGQQSNNIIVKNEVNVAQSSVSADSALTYAFGHRDEVLINEKKYSLAELKYGMLKLTNRPFLSLQASGGAKNGYIPYLNRLTPNYVIGVGIKVPIFDGMKNKYNLAQAQSAITTVSYEADNAKRGISNEVYESEALMFAAERKIGQSALQLKQAQKAYSLAETSFRSGVITNLDLLDANTAVSESSLMLLKTRIDYATSIFRYRAALGERIY
jgi:outer membrane protein